MSDKTPLEIFLAKANVRDAVFSEEEFSSIEAALNPDPRDLAIRDMHNTMVLQTMARLNAWKSRPGLISLWPEINAARIEIVDCLAKHAAQIKRVGEKDGQ